MYCDIKRISEFFVAKLLLKTSANDFYKVVLKSFQLNQEEIQRKKTLLFSQILSAYQDGRKICM